MENFIYYTPTKVYFGKNQEDKIAEILKEFNATKILLHYGQNSVIKSGLLAKIESYLKSSNLTYFKLGGVEPNPKLSLVEKGVKLVKEKQIDFILAIGGGSVIDSAKSISVGTKINESPWVFSIHEKTPKEHLPLGVILTIAASGSDMSDSCVITNDKTGEKRGFNSNLNRPSFAILNPELTYTVSPYQTACGIVDIMMHTLERFISFSDPTPLTDNLAIALLKSTYEAGLVVMENPKNFDARATLLWANSLSHNGLTSCGRNFVMSVHQLEHELSGLHDHVAHGAGLAVLWPSWALNAYPYALERFKKLVYEFLEIKPTEDANQDIELGINKLKEYFKNIGMPTTLRELNIPKEDLEKLAVNVTYNYKRVVKDVITVDKDMALKIYNEAY